MKKLILPLIVGLLVLPVTAQENENTRLVLITGAGQSAVIMVDIPDGTMTKLGEFPIASVDGPWWSADGESVLVAGYYRDHDAYDLIQLEIEVSEPSTLVEMYSDTVAYVSSDRQHVAFWSVLEEDTLIIDDIPGGNRRSIMVEGCCPVWSPDSEWLYTSGETLHRTRLDDTETQDITPDSLTFIRDVAFSNDGEWMAFSASDEDGNWDIYTARTDGSSLSRLTEDDGHDEQPAWSPDDEQIVFSSDHAPDEYPGNNLDLYLMNRNGSDVRQLTDLAGDEVQAAFSPDGLWLAYKFESHLSPDECECEGGLIVVAMDGELELQITDESLPLATFAWSPIR